MNPSRYTVHTFKGQAWILDTHATLQAYGTLSGPPVAVRDRNGRIKRYDAISAARRRANRLNRSTHD